MRKAVATASRPTPAPGPGTRNAAFDGAWNVIVTCPAAADGALGYTLEFVAQVKDSYLRGVHGVEGTPDSLRIEGPIQPDGTASLDAKGLTGDPKYSVKRTQKGSAYGYHVAARFEGSRGSGARVEVRPCDLRFAKQ